MHMRQITSEQTYNDKQSSIQSFLPSIRSKTPPPSSQILETQRDPPLQNRFLDFPLILLMMSPDAKFQDEIH